ncbi:protein of unknown function (plasmid) [Pararobbsia alpina]
MTCPNADLSLGAKAQHFPNCLTKSRPRPIGKVASPDLGVRSLSQTGRLNVAPST